MNESTPERKERQLRAVIEGRGCIGDVTTWFEHVYLVHQALPDLSTDDIDLSQTFAGHVFAAPLFISGMTGGIERAAPLNRAFARVASRLGIPFGVGSQRAMLENPELTRTYCVRDVARDVFLVGNIGATALLKYSFSKIFDALDAIEANAVCVHLNPAQELAQPDGDRDFRGLLEAISDFVRASKRPVIVKEVGCGISRETGLALRKAGVAFVDVAGAGGTSFVRVERDGSREGQWSALFGWGIPTAASLLEVCDLGFEVIGSGGIRTGLDAAKAIALGAKMVGVGAPLIQAWARGGEEAVWAWIRDVLEGLKIVMALTGSKNLAALSKTPKVIVGPLAEWARARLGKVP